MGNTLPAKKHVAERKLIQISLFKGEDVQLLYVCENIKQMCH